MTPRSPFPPDLALAALAQQSTGTIGVSSAPTSYTSSSATGECTSHTYSPPPPFSPLHPFHCFSYYIEHIYSFFSSYLFSHPTSSSFPSIFPGLGNLGSAALGAATSPSQKSLGMGGLTNDTILQVRRGTLHDPHCISLRLPLFWYCRHTLACSRAHRVLCQARPSSHRSHCSNSHSLPVSYYLSSSCGGAKDDGG